MEEEDSRSTFRASVSVQQQRVQGYPAHKKTHPPRTLQGYLVYKETYTKETERI